MRTHSEPALLCVLCSLPPHRAPAPHARRRTLFLSLPKASRRGGPRAPIAPKAPRPPTPRDATRTCPKCPPRHVTAPRVDSPTSRSAEAPTAEGRMAAGRRADRRRSRRPPRARSPPPRCCSEPVRRVEPRAVGAQYCVEWSRFEYKSKTAASPHRNRERARPPPRRLLGRRRRPEQQRELQFGVRAIEICVHDDRIEEARPVHVRHLAARVLQSHLWREIWGVRYGVT